MRIAAVTVALLSSTFLFAQNKPGTVIANGDVNVDGKHVEHTASIFAKEKLETGGDGAASITSDGTVSSVAGTSKMVYGDNALDLECGEVQVVTINQFQVRADDIVTSPASNAKTEYKVQQRHNELKITALEGPISVKKGQEQSTLNPGDSKTYHNVARCPVGIPGWVPGAIWAATVIPWLPDRDRDVSGDEP